MTSMTTGQPNAAEADRVSGDIDPFAQQLKSRYVQRRRADLQRLPKALAERDFAAIRLAGHNMYGSGSAYGFDEVTAIGRALERAAETGQTTAIEALIAKLEKFVAAQHAA